MSETPEPGRTGRKNFTSEISTFRPGEPLPTHRVNLATMVDILAHQLGVVTTIPALRRLPGITKQVVSRTLYLDVEEVLEIYRKKFAEAPIIKTGVAKRPAKVGA